MTANNTKIEFVSGQQDGKPRLAYRCRACYNLRQRRYMRTYKPKDITQREV